MLYKVMPNDVEQTSYYFDLPLGDDLAGRKNYIAEVGHEYLDMEDLS